MPERVLHVEPGYCTCSDVYECIKGYKARGAPFTKKNWSRWFTSVPGIEFTPDVVRWTKNGSTTLHRGLTLDGFRKALDRLYELEHITAGRLPYPPRFGITGIRRYIVGRSIAVIPQEDLPTLGRERWSEPAKEIIAQEVKAGRSSPQDLVDLLVAKDLRKPGLLEKNLIRQIERMALSYYSMDELTKYKKKFLPRSRGPRNVSTEASEASKEPSKSAWTEEMDRALVEDALSIRISKVGVTNFERIKKRFLRRKLRKVKTYQTMRHRLRQLALYENGLQYGLTEELWHKINSSRGTRVQPENPARSEVPPSTPTTPTTTNGAITVDLGGGIVVTVSKEAQEEAQQAYMTEERTKEAVLLHFKNRGL
jgi:hypothetical protein